MAPPKTWPDECTVIDSLPRNERDILRNDAQTRFRARVKEALAG